MEQNIAVGFKLSKRKIPSRLYELVMMLVEDNQDKIRVSMLLHTKDKANSGCNLAVGLGLLTVIIRSAKIGIQLIY